MNVKKLVGSSSVYEDFEGNRILKNNGKTLVKQDKNGTIKRFCDWSFFTKKHIFAFCGLSKNDFMALPLEV